MNIKTKITVALAHRSMSQATLARSIGMTPANFSLKAKRETFTQSELESIAKALNARYVQGFILEEGIEIL